MTNSPRLSETLDGFWDAVFKMSREGVHHPGQGILYPVLRIVGDNRVFTWAPDHTLWRTENGGFSAIHATKRETAEIDRAVYDDRVEVFVRTKWGGNRVDPDSKFLRYLHRPMARGWE